MADICRSCAFRAQRGATSAVRQQVQRRTFSVSSTQQKRVGPPVFTETTKPELDTILSTLRDSHFIPAYLNKRQRHLIFGDKFKTELENTPAYATLGDEEVQLKHIDRRRAIPARRPLVRKAVSLMRDAEDWRALPGLLEGLHKGGSTPDADFQEKTVRKAVEAGQVGIVIRCLNRAALTGLTLKNANVLNSTLWGLHEQAQVEGWGSEEEVRKALRQGLEVAQLLESGEHGSGRRLALDDPRSRPTTVAIYLELSAVLAQKYQGGRDTDGSVKKYADRLLACINDNNQPRTLPTLPKSGPQTEFLARFPTWHGLTLASHILSPSNELPHAAKAQATISEYEARLTQIVAELEAVPQKNGYVSQALEAWNAAIRV